MERMGHHDATPNTKILRLRVVTERVGLSRSTLWRLVKSGSFPRPLELSVGAIGWREADIEQWISNLPSLNEKSSASE